MEIKNSQQERMEKQKTPEGKKKKLITNLVTGVIILGCLGGVYVMNRHPAFIGTPHVITVDGTTVEPGVTTVKELSDAGFHLSDFKQKAMDISGSEVRSYYKDYYDISAMADEKSYYISILLIKNEEPYGTIDVVNESASKVPLSQCVIRQISVYNTNLLCEEATIDGLSFSGITPDSMKQALGDPNRESTSTTDNQTKYIWEKGHYKAEITLDKDGSPVQILSKYVKKD